MENYTAELELAFTAYRQEIAEYERKSRPTDGLLGFGRSLGNDACHDHLDARIEQIVRQACEAEVAPQEAEALVRALLLPKPALAHGGAVDAARCRAAQHPADSPAERGSRCGDLPGIRRALPAMGSAARAEAGAACAEPGARGCGTEDTGERLSCGRFRTAAARIGDCAAGWHIGHSGPRRSICIL